MKFVAVIVTILFVVGMSSCKSISSGNMRATSLDTSNSGGDGGGGY